MAEQIQRNIVVNLKSDNSGLRRGLRAGSTALKGFGRQLKNIRGVTLGLGGGIAALAGAAGLLAIANSARNAIDANAKLAKTLKTSVSVIQELKLAAELSGIDTGKLTGSVSKLSQVLGKQLLSPSKEVSIALAQLGLTAKDFADHSPVDAFKRIIEQLGYLEDPLAQAGVGTALFGRSFKDLIPLIDSAESTFARTNEVFREMGLGLSDHAAAGVEKLDDDLTVLATVGGALAQKTFADLVPFIDVVTTAILEFTKQMIAGAGGADNLVRAISDGIVQSFSDLITMIPEVITHVKNAIAPFQMLADIIGKVLKFVGTAGGGIAAAASLAASGEFSAAGSALSNLGGDLAGQLLGEDAEKELSQQTSLLRRIAEDKLLAAAG